LERWWRLDFVELQNELLKSYKTKTPVADRDEWQTFFENAKIERDSVDLQIKLLEKELNVEVYELFGLDDEEIGMIEGEK
jgi:hypothetical protein